MCCVRQPRCVVCAADVHALWCCIELAELVQCSVRSVSAGAEHVVAVLCKVLFETVETPVAVLLMHAEL